MLYFAYGSLMESEQRQVILSEASSESNSARFDVLGVAKLNGWKFKINKLSKSNDRVWANIVEDDNGQVWGVLLDIDKSVKKKLDEREGVALCERYRYEVVFINVHFEGRAVEVMTYTAHPSAINNDLLAISTYVNTILNGARQNVLPSEYIEYLEGFTTQ